uniref:Uncharacterized protein n=1 Tax=Tanacetum cinerariifolium TaxID=118510 RepID=A0A6L2MFM0_TANCI|nr:hypothetical protein [Tanacetum cinerariifolium]
MITFEVLDELMEITGSTELHKRMRIWFVQEIAEEEGILRFLRDRYDELRRRSARRRVLIGEMETLEARGVAVDCLDCLKQTQVRETDMLAALTEVLVETQAGIHEKEGHVMVEYTVDEIHALVLKVIHEDSVRQKAMMDLVVQFDNAGAIKQDHRQAYEKCNDIPQETRTLIDTFLKRESDKDYEMNLAMYRKA